MKKLKWYYNTKEKCWTIENLLHPTIKITEETFFGGSHYKLLYSGRMTSEISFSKTRKGFQCAKKVAELIHNG